MGYQKGDMVRVTGTFTDSADAAFDPSNVQVLVKDPDGTKIDKTWPASPEIVKDATGVFHMDVDTGLGTITKPHGTWWYRFYGTAAAGASRGAGERQFEVDESEF